jgi:clan AA aspartic protease (TIGR02281 family)
MENSANWQGPLGAFACLGAIACIWSVIGFGVTGWHWNNDPPAQSRSGELATPLSGNRCLVDVWGSASSGQGGRFTALFDSGATYDLWLTRSDAATVGLDVGSLWFVFPYRSLSGMGWVARTSIAQLRIGGAVLRDVPVSVIYENSSGVSLVGLPILSRLSFTLRGGSCVVSW